MGRLVHGRSVVSQRRGRGACDWREGSEAVVVEAARALGRILLLFCAGTGFVFLLYTAPPTAGEHALQWPQLGLGPAITGFVGPLHITHAGDRSGRLFVVERWGRVRIVKNGVLVGEPFLDIRDRVASTGQEDGLLSVAFPPTYASEGLFYVFYSDLDGNIVVARYRLSTNPDVADPDSEEVVLSIEHPTYTNHYGGQLAFGPADGLLYIGTGDGGGTADPGENAQNPQSLLGKILRIDVESRQSPYRIPTTNPYTQTAGYRGEIWALGLRNPWHFSFDRQTGDLYIGDVGQASREEINFQPAASPGGENYGWPILEGTLCFNSPPGCTPPSRYSSPVVEYSHANGDLAVTGGIVFRGPDSPRMRGIYVYGDVYSGRIWGLQQDGGRWHNRLLYNAPFYVTAFGEDQAGNLYVAGFDTGAIYPIKDLMLEKHLYLPFAAR